MACVVSVPALAFMLATLNSTASPEARHLIFALPFFSMLARGPARRARAPSSAADRRACARRRPDARRRRGALGARKDTAALRRRSAGRGAVTRSAAGAWLAAGNRSSDVLLGYEPVYLRAWEQHRSFSAHVLPRADPALLASTLKDIPEPLGRGVWVFDASDTTNSSSAQTIPFVLPAPGSAFEGRVYGPFLVIRSRRPLVTRARYLKVSEARHAIRASASGSATRTSICAPCSARRHGSSRSRFFSTISR